MHEEDPIFNHREVDVVTISSESDIETTQADTVVAFGDTADPDALGDGCLDPDPDDVALGDVADELYGDIAGPDDAALGDVADPDDVPDPYDVDPGDVADPDASAAIADPYGVDPGGITDADPLFMNGSCMEPADLDLMPPPQPPPFKKTRLVDTRPPLLIDQNTWHLGYVPSEMGFVCRNR